MIILDSCKEEQVQVPRKSNHKLSGFNYINNIILLSTEMPN